MIDKDGDIKPPSQFWELGVVAIAAIFTLSGVALCFFGFSPPHASAPQSTELPQVTGEVTIGIGQGQTIHPRPTGILDRGVIPPDPHEPVPAKPQ